MRFRQMIDEGLVEIRQQRSGNLADFPQKLLAFSTANASQFGWLLAASHSMLAILPKRIYSSDVVKPILAIASRVIQWGNLSTDANAAD